MAVTVRLPVIGAIRLCGSALAAIACAAGAFGCSTREERNMPSIRETVIASEISCPSCSVVVDTVVTLENVELSPRPGAIAWDPAGVFYVVDRSDGLLKAFGADGRFVRQIGRQGGGPGEYEMIRNVMVGPDGSIHVLDGVLGRHTVFSREGNVVKTTRVPMTPAIAMSAALWPDGHLAVNTTGSPVRATGAVPTVHLIDTDGNVVRSVDVVPLDQRAQWRQWRHLWVRRDGTLLVARPYSLTIEVYDRDFSKIASISRRVEWFPSQEPQSRPSDGVFDEPFTPLLNGLWEDAGGLLWLQVMVPSRLWTPRRREARLHERTCAELAERPRIDVIIEVLDLERRRVLAHSRFDGPLGAPFGGGFLANPGEGKGGEPAILISRITLKR